MRVGREGQYIYKDILSHPRRPPATQSTTDFFISEDINQHNIEALTKICMTFLSV